MKKRIISLILLSLLTLTGCREADRASYNLSREADAFNVVRQLTVINCIQNDVLFQMTGRISIHEDTTDNQLEITVKNEDGSYSKHFVGLSDNVTYVVEDLDKNNINGYAYSLIFNPKMWCPAYGKIDTEE